MLVASDALVVLPVVPLDVREHQLDRRRVVAAATHINRLFLLIFSDTQRQNTITN